MAKTTSVDGYISTKISSRMLRTPLGKTKTISGGSRGHKINDSASDSPKKRSFTGFVPIICLKAFVAVFEQKPSQYAVPVRIDQFMGKSIKIRVDFNQNLMDVLQCFEHH